MEPVRRFTWKELSKLNEPHNAHVAVRGKVYDVSSFVARHPGGMEQIMMGAGRDITPVFESYHPFSMYSALNKFYVGELVDNETPIFPKQSEFHQVLKERVNKFFKDNNIDPKIDYLIFMRYAFIMISAVLCWTSIMLPFVYESWVLLMIAALAAGTFSAFFITSPVHDASHFALTHKPWVWKLVGAVYDFFIGASILVWTYQHIFGHHPYTNIDGADPDIVTASEGVNDIRRIKWKQKWIPRYFYQHIYVPLLYGVLGLKTRLQDFYILMFSLKNGNIRMNRPFLNQRVIFFVGKLWYMMYRFVIPAFMMPWPQVLVANVVSDMCMSYWLALTFQVSHVVGEVEWPKPDKDNAIHVDWAELQVAATMDYATNSWFWTFITGALNHQITHHLFPGVNQAHYPKITPIVAQTCKEYGIPYHYKDTFNEALGCHIGLLKNMGQTTVGKLDSKKEH